MFRNLNCPFLWLNFLDFTKSAVNVCFCIIILKIHVYYRLKFIYNLYGYRFVVGDKYMFLYNKIRKTFALFIFLSAFILGGCSDNRDSKDILENKNLYTNHKDEISSIDDIGKAKSDTYENVSDNNATGYDLTSSYKNNSADSFTKSDNADEKINGINIGNTGRFRYYTKEEKLSVVNAIIDAKENDNSESLRDALNELSGIDSEKEKAIENICNYWDTVNSDNFVNCSHIPDSINDDDSNAIVVLGFCLNPDGSMKKELEGRLFKAVSIYKKYPNSYILVTGGGTATQNKQATEANCMADWLEENGVSRDKIIIENKSQTTIENALFSAEILNDKYPKIDKITIVTSDYHISYGALLFETVFEVGSSNGMKEMHVVANYAYMAHSNDIFSKSNQARAIKSICGNMF